MTFRGQSAPTRSAPRSPSTAPRTATADPHGHRPTCSPSGSSPTGARPPPCSLSTWSRTTTRARRWSSATTGISSAGPYREATQQIDVSLDGRRVNRIRHIHATNANALVGRRELIGNPKLPAAIEFDRSRETASGPFQAPLERPAGAAGVRGLPAAGRRRPGRGRARDMTRAAPHALPDGRSGCAGRVRPHRGRGPRRGDVARHRCSGLHRTLRGRSPAPDPGRRAGRDRSRHRHDAHPVEHGARFRPLRETTTREPQPHRGAASGATREIS
ncbi:acetoacetate decarboxylase family protein [Streptomyces actuosus]|uniref:Acetoacetate decarboxylase family protein n=1 Tax=Streptomyces actuosus TaxID=1885 RepID=A0ABS2VZD0_STRAS|nr:acetoacetate decarboxylase family protein [Streptomyces actuosus]